MHLLLGQVGFRHIYIYIYIYMTIMKSREAAVLEFGIYSPIMLGMYYK